MFCIKMTIFMSLPKQNSTHSPCGTLFMCVFSNNIRRKLETSRNPKKKSVRLRSRYPLYNAKASNCVVNTILILDMHLQHKFVLLPCVFRLYGLTV